MKRIKILEVCAKENLKDADECVNDVIANAKRHEYVDDGSVDIKVSTSYNQWVNIKIADLEKMVEELKAEGSEYVEVSFIDADKFGNLEIPATINFSVYDGNGGSTDYGSIENIEVDAFYKMNKDLEVI